MTSNKQNDSGVQVAFVNADAARELSLAKSIQLIAEEGSRLTNGFPSESPDRVLNLSIETHVAHVCGKYLG